MTAQTPFKIGSLSKSVTAVAVMQLVEAGRINLDSPVGQYLPWFRTRDAADANKVTVRHLLHHRSGLAGDEHYKPNRVYAEELKNLIIANETLVLKYPPGTRFRYWNTGYDLLGAVVSAVSGKEFPTYVQEHIFKPLKMDRSYVSVTEAARHGLTGFRFFFGFPYKIDSEAHHPPVAAGGMISCAEDLGKYVTSLMGAGDGKDEILNEESRRHLLEAFESRSEGRSYAMGWEVVQHSDQPGVKIVTHGGVTDESHANIAFNPEQKLAVIMLANSSDSTQIRVGNLVHATTEEFLRKERLGRGREKHPMYGQIMVATSIIGGMPVLQGLGVILTLRRLRIWRRNPPIASRRIPIVHWWMPLLANVLIAIVMLWALPSGFGFSLYGFLRSAPDWGSLAVVSGIFALGWGIIRSRWVARALRRQSAGVLEAASAPVG